MVLPAGRVPVQAVSLRLFNVCRPVGFEMPRRLGTLDRIYMIYIVQDLVPWCTLPTPVRHPGGCDGYLKSSRWKSADRRKNETQCRDVTDGRIYLSLPWALLAGAGP
jgi:hypothetical protein